MAYPERGGCTHVVLGLFVCAFADQQTNRLQMTIVGGQVEGGQATLQRGVKGGKRVRGGEGKEGSKHWKESMQRICVTDLCATALSTGAVFKAFWDKKRKRHTLPPEAPARVQDLKLLGVASHSQPDPTPVMGGPWEGRDVPHLDGGLFGLREGGTAKVFLST